MSNRTCIYVLLQASERSHWHRLDATDIWLYHAGAPLILSLSETSDGPTRDHLLSPDLTKGAPQLIVPENHVQSARSTGDFTLVSCTVSPGFHFDGFTLAAAGMDIPRWAPCLVRRLRLANVPSNTQTTPMNHTQFIASLSPAQKEALHRRSTLRGLVHLAGHIGAVIAMALYIATGAPFWQGMLLPYGITLMFLFTLSHECTHATPFAPPRLSDVVGHLVSLPLLLPFTWFRYFHLAHHKYTNDPDRDPELADGGRPTNWRAYLVYLSGWAYWSGNASLIWHHARGHVAAPYLPPRKHAPMIREARILLALYTIIALSLLFNSIALWLWIIPALIGQVFLRLYLLAEHGHCPPVANMLENTRTTLTNRTLRFIAWNMPYHAEHHAMPMVPFHALPTLHGEIQSHLKSVSHGYREFTQDYTRTLDR